MKQAWIVVGAGVLACVPMAGGGLRPGVEAKTGSVIFLHPDGAGLAHWGAARIFHAGPDGELNWDRLPGMAVYRGHMKNTVAASSHGGGTTHAYGVKVPIDSFGMHGRDPLTSLSGKPFSVMREAMEAGLAVGICNSGALYEPGTAAFLASITNRAMSEEITRQIVQSGAEVILGGGENWLRPKGMKGRHGEPGERTDGLDLLDWARTNGYAVVFTRDELAALPADTRRVLGVFAADHTFHELPEEVLREKNLPLYEDDAPDVSEMMAAALKVLTASGRRFLLVVEEEGTDNFSNNLVAKGTLEALRRADRAVGGAREFVSAHPDTLLLTAADSDASGLELTTAPGKDPTTPLPARDPAGAPLDGRDGTATPPFLAAPDRAGVRLPFGILWTGKSDNAGGILARTEGLNAGLLGTTCDNTDVYRLIYATLFGRVLP
jgi:alkaline phosphatase